MNRINEWLNDNEIMLVVRLVITLIIIVILVLFAFGIWDNLTIDMLINAALNISILGFISLFAIMGIRMISNDKATIDEYKNNDELTKTEEDINDITFTEEEDDRVIDAVNKHNDMEQSKANNDATQIVLQKFKMKLRNAKYKNKKRKVKRYTNKIEKLKQNKIHVKIQYTKPNDIHNINESAKTRNLYGRKKHNASHKNEWYKQFKITDIFKFIMLGGSGTALFFVSDKDALRNYALGLLGFILFTLVLAYISKRKYLATDYLKQLKNHLKLKQWVRNEVDKPLQKETESGVVTFDEMIERNDLDD